jgi:hypothetical protein
MILNCETVNVYGKNRFQSLKLFLNSELVILITALAYPQNMGMERQTMKLPLEQFCDISISASIFCTQVDRWKH